MQNRAIGPIFKMLRPGASLQIKNVLVSENWATVELRIENAVTKKGEGTACLCSNSANQVWKVVFQDLLQKVWVGSLAVSA